MAGSRLLVHEDVRDALIDKIVARADSIRLGDPTDPDTEMGPVANQPQYEKVLGYLQGAATDGATFACGGEPDASAAAYSSSPPWSPAWGRVTPSSVRRSSDRSLLPTRSGTRTRRSGSPTTPRMAWRERSEPRTCTGRTALRPSCARARCG